MYIGWTPSVAGAGKGRSRRASDSKSPAGPVAKVQWKNTGNVSSRVNGACHAGPIGVPAVGAPPRPRVTPASKAGTRQAA